MTVAEPSSLTAARPPAAWLAAWSSAKSLGAGSAYGDRGGERGLEEPASIDHAASPAATVLPRNAERSNRNAA